MGGRAARTGGRVSPIYTLGVQMSFYTVESDGFHSLQSCGSSAIDVQLVVIEEQYPGGFDTQFFCDMLKHNPIRFQHSGQMGWETVMELLNKFRFLTESIPVQFIGIGQAGQGE